MPTDSEFVKSVTMKARVYDREKISAAIFAFTDSQGESARLEDVYFKISHGYMKLRVTNHQQHYGTLIHYTQNYRSGVGTNDARITPLEEVAPIKKTLVDALGVLGTVEMERRVYVKGNVRVNLDDVENLGTFVYIEVCADAHDVSTPTKTIVDIQEQLGIEDMCVIGKSYINMLLELEYPPRRLYTDDDTNCSDNSL